ncbi:MAG: PCYCGC domain-containing protein [Acidobacteriota bacterium]|nr:PCYCGC domain-containing protein [Acidobacteriota bacterium]
MKRNRIFIKLAVIIVAFGIIACTKQQATIEQPAARQTGVSSGNSLTSTPKPKPPMPAYQSEMSAKDLPATLAPEMFTGTVRAAYAAVKEIPETIAQLPCYCHCDKAFGHKSLHTCFVDNHAEQCSVCMNSALKAYKLKKEKKMTPAQIREELTAEYGR